MNAGLISDAPVLSQGEPVELTRPDNRITPGRIGMIGPEVFADTVLVDSNPVEELEVLPNTHRVDCVMKDGAVCNSTPSPQL